MQKLTSELKSVLYQNGAALIGCADLSEVITSDLKYGVSIVMPVKGHIVEEIMEGPTEAYFDDYQDLEKRLSKAALCGEAFLKGHGYQAYTQTPQRVRENEDWRTELPHKTVATNAGIGWIGKSCLLVTEEFGSAIRLSSILTNAPLICDARISESRCGECRKCVDSCPAQALSGVTWHVGVDRDEILMNKEACVEKQVELTRKNTGYEAEFLCGKCFAVCPYTQRYIKKMHSQYAGCS